MSHPYESFMREAVELAERGRWSAAPNPTVGAVLVRDGVVVARGWHTAYGKSHAEVECLKDAEAKGVDPSACTLVVTLEPCNHQGQTPPCTEAVIAAAGFDANVRGETLGIPEFARIANEIVRRREGMRS